MRWCGCSFDILIYSGDADFILNHMGSVNWITAATGLNASVAVPWQKWLGSDGQVAGYYEMCVPAFAPTCARCLWIAQRRFLFVCVGLFAAAIRGSLS